jgi:hypothetical protein
MIFRFLDQVSNPAFVFMFIFVLLGFLPMLYSIWRTWQSHEER